MIILCPAFILLAIVSTAFSRCSRIPQEYNCAWERNSCSQGRIYLAQCNCGCGLGNILCCDPSILEEYHYPIWRGTAPFCNAECPRSCEYDESLCWWQSKCGNGSRCLTGNKVLCGERRRKSWWPFLNKVVSPFLYYIIIVFSIPILAICKKILVDYKFTLSYQCIHHWITYYVLICNIRLLLRAC